VERRRKTRAGSAAGSVSAAHRGRGKHTTSSTASAITTSIYQLHISLRHLKPAIWRRVLVPGSITLDKLHRIIQIVMGWSNSHMHEFTVGNIHYGVPDKEFADLAPVVSEKRATLSACLAPSVKSFGYLYDFGDSWEHSLRIEKILNADPALRYPVCLAGANACPPDDVGGPPGYVNFVQAISDPHHPEHRDMLEWCGGSFDPYAFNPETVNADLKRFKL
jgi:hypothetical protein